MNDPVQALRTALSDYLPWHGARLSFLARFLLALFKVRSVNLAELATGFGGKAQAASSYKRLQRFFRSFEIDREVCSLRQFCQGEALLDFVRSVLATENVAERLEQLAEKVKTWFPLAPSGKHMSGRDLGRQHPSPSLKYRAAQIAAT